MAKEKVVKKHQPKSLTSAQRMYVEQLQTRFGDRFTNVKRSELLKAANEILKLKYAPGWITRNLKVRNKEKRGMYDLSPLLKLPVVAFEEVKKARAKKKEVTKKVSKTPKVVPVNDDPVVDTETAISAVKPVKKTKKVKNVVATEPPPVVEVETVPELVTDENPVAEQE